MLGDATVMVECDAEDCGAGFEITLTEYLVSGKPIWNEDDMPEILEGRGWRVEGNQHFCSNHPKEVPGAE